MLGIKLFVAISFIMSAISLYKDMLEKRLPTKINLETVNNYLNSSHHWHSYGHFFVQFTLVQVLGTVSVTGLIIGVVISLASPFFIELVLQKASLKDKDTIFDIATHMLGTLAGLSLFL